MFTGIINHLGTIVATSPTSLTIKAPTELYAQLTYGMSVAVNGICLTVVKRVDPDQFTIDFMPETAKKTTIGDMEIADQVNLELPVTTSTLFAGHIVQGHVDTIAQVSSITQTGNSRLIVFEVSKKITRYIVAKGSIAINGISLTVIDANMNTFSVGIIPHTWTHTMLHQIHVGTNVNIEVDILAKYLEKLTQKV